MEGGGIIGGEELTGGENMPHIRPITDLHNASEISELCHSTAEPVFITKNGYGDMVIMSMETYERSIAPTDICEKLDVAEKQIADGDMLDCEAALTGLEARSMNDHRRYSNE